MLLWVLILSVHCDAQKNYIKGIVQDTAIKKNLVWGSASLIDDKDSALYISVRTNESGAFEITKIPSGRYTLMVSYPHMADYLQPVIVTDTSTINIGKITMVTAQVLLQEVIIKSGTPPIRMRGDTLEYNADSFAVQKGANVQELLKRLPGITVDSKGKITAQGKEVKKVLVDGDEFFSDDPGLATQFLGADAIDKVQVFDKKSDKTEFTGIDDGRRTKTINLKLKNNKKNGAFGKAAAGSDGDKYHDHQAMASLFSGAKKMSVFGLSSKTGKEGLGYNELSKYVGQDYEQIDDGTGNSYISNNEYENENYGGSGLPDIKSGGVHYSNKWKDGRQKLFSNYRIKNIDAVNWSNGTATTKLPDGTGFINKNSSAETSSDFSQKASGNFTAQIDSLSTIKISLNGRSYHTTHNSTGYSSSKNEKDILVNNSASSNRSIWDGYNFGGNISYLHKFKKEGRTVSVTAQQDGSDWRDDEYNYSDNNYYDPASGSFTRADTLDQLQKSHNTAHSFATKITYTEKLGKLFRLSVDYGWKKINTQNKFSTFKNENGRYDLLLDTLSNDYDFNIATNIAGATFGYNTKKLNFSIGSRAYFTGFQQINNDVKTTIKRNFTNIAPQATMTLNLKENTSLSFGYTGETFQPSADQLQPLRKSSNPLYVQIGNPLLSPGFRHSLSLSFYQYKWTTGKSLNAYLSASYAQNDFTSKSTTDAQNRTITQYINLNSVPGFYGSIDYGWAYKKLHLRPSVRLSVNSDGNNNFLNGAEIKSKNFSGTAGLSLNYDLQDKFSATYSGSTGYNKSRSNIQNAINGQTITHTHVVSFTKFFGKKIELGSDCTFNFQPRTATFNSSVNTVQWNASLLKKFLKNDHGFVKLSINDILNSNTGYSRSTNGSNVYESDRLVIKRYFLVTLGWNFLKSIK